MTAETNNVVIFPDIRRRNILQSLEEVISHVEENRKEHIQYLVDDISDYVLQRAEVEGFHVTSEEHAKSTLLFIESMRAMLYSSARIKHPLHKITEQVILANSEKEED
jgi:RNase adaptor protein for sRNA GlmZ degradation